VTYTSKSHSVKPYETEPALNGNLCLSASCFCLQDVHWKRMINYLQQTKSV